MSRFDVTFRPIDTWPGELTAVRRSTPFYSTYSQTLTLLRTELDHLDASAIVIQLALDESQIRLDGMPRAGATPAHPGVILAFDSKHGPLKYATDVFTHWEANVRAIALELEALRKVERYGITKRGEQYTGWKALGSGIEMGPATMTWDEAAAFLHDAAGWTGDWDPEADRIHIDVAYRMAAKRLHPDRGGDPEQFKRLGDAKRILDGAA